MSDTRSIIYRQAWYGNRPKSVALRRESDYHTGLSFNTEPPIEGPYFVYSVSTLHDAGFMAEPNEGELIVSRWDTNWVMRDASGEARRYGSGHVSVYRDQAAWYEWYQAELQVVGDGSTDFSRKFYELALEYREDTGDG